MRILFVTPVEQGSGETITCLHMAESVTARGHEIRFLASPFAGKFLSQHFPDQIQPLGSDGRSNRKIWDDSMASFRPDAVVFADYPLLFFAGGAAPLADDPVWVEGLDSLDACLITLDHFGFAQEEMGLFFGPPHLSFHYQVFPAIPDRMNVMLPCPMHEPGNVEGRKGHPFRYWQVPIEIPATVRRETRDLYLKGRDEHLVFHSVPNWAWRMAEALGLPFYRYLPVILEYYLADLGKPVTLVSVNNGGLLSPPPDGTVRFLNLEPIPKTQFEGLLFGSDLVLTENSVSISMGKAICGLRNAGAMTNSMRLVELLDRLEGPLRDIVLAMERERMGSVYPFNVFPTGMIAELERIVLYRDNSLTRCFRNLEIFGGDKTRQALHDLLVDAKEREVLATARLDYVDRLRNLADCTDILEQVVAGG
jgi:hypothetical protein